MCISNQSSSSSSTTGKIYGWRDEDSVVNAGPLKPAIRQVLGDPGLIGSAYKLSEVSAQRLPYQYEEIVDEVAHFCLDHGLDSPDKIRGYCGKAARADFCHTFLTFLAAGAVSYGASGIVLWIVSVMATAALGPFAPVAAIVIPCIVSFAFLWKYGVHLLYAGARVGIEDSKTRRPDGTDRRRFTKPAHSTTLLRAYAREVAAQTPGTVISLTLIVGLKLLLGFVQTIPIWLSFWASPFMTGIGTVFSALAFSLRPLVHKRTRAPLFGIDVFPNGEMSFDQKQAEANWTRLGRPVLRRIGSTLDRFGAAYGKSFPSLFREERQTGMTRDKKIELILGGGPVAFTAAGIQGIATMNSSPAIQGIASGVRSLGVNTFTNMITNPFTVEPVLGNFDNIVASRKSAKAPAPPQSYPVPPRAQTR